MASSSGAGYDRESGRSKESVVSKLIKAYNFSLLQRPLLTKCFTSALTAAVGDIIGQLIKQQDHYNVRQTCAFIMFGFCATGPITHQFYSRLSTLIPAHLHYSKVYRLFIERIVFAPLFLLLFFYAVPLLQGMGFTATHQRVLLLYWSAVKANWRFWSLFQYINVNYIPVQHQPLFASLLALVWNVYLSLKQ